MSNKLKTTGTLVGGNNFAAFEIDNLFYRASEVKYRQKVVLPYLEQGQSYRVDLEGKLKHPLLVTSIYADHSNDDATVADTGFSNDPMNNNDFYLWVRVIDRKTNKVIEEFFYTVNTSNGQFREFILSPEYIYQFRGSLRVNSITFTGEPIYFFDSVVINDVTNRSTPPSQLKK